MRLKISARKSDLARLQAYRVAEAIVKQYPDTKVEFLFKESLGDKNLNDPLWKMPEKGVFTEDFLQDLLSGQTDMVVHSWKDLPTQTHPETLIAATLQRADQRDLLLLKTADIERIRQNNFLRILSSSPRRAHNLTDFLRLALPFDGAEVRFESVRGNIPTRVRKLMESEEVSGLIVAKAALDRLLSAPEAEFASIQGQLRKQLQALYWMVLPLSVNPNAAAQGALAIEISKQRQDILGFLAAINHQETFAAVAAEREILSRYGGGCHQKIGVAILPRSYGNIRICRGLTDGGENLQQHGLVKVPQKTYDAADMWSGSSELFFRREPLALPDNRMEGLNAVLVAKAAAWPPDFPFSGVVWASGVATWKKLAQNGVWVNGCQDALGEHEPEYLEVLAGQPLRWGKLSHEQGFPIDGRPVLASYRLVAKSVDELNNEFWWPEFLRKKAFYWSSGSLFLRAMECAPTLLRADHFCGPGSTQQVIKKYFSDHLGSVKKDPEIYLSPEEWNVQCTTNKTSKSSP